MTVLTSIGFDADDTLWQNEKFFRVTEDSFISILSEYSTCQDLKWKLLETERKNLKRYGFGIKGFLLSMIETALEITDNRVPPAVIRQIIDLGQELQAHPIELLPGAEEVVRDVASRHTVVLVTKGDLLDQERKLAQSGLGELFDGIEIVSDKSPDVYRRTFREYGTGPEAAMMIGNSVKSDVIPALEAGCWGILIPHELTWELEHAELPSDHPRFGVVSGLHEIPELVSSIAAREGQGEAAA